MDVRLGLTDGSSTEVVSGDSQEGAEVIVGLVDPARARRPGGAFAAVCRAARFF